MLIYTSAQVNAALEKDCEARNRSEFEKSFRIKVLNQLNSGEESEFLSEIDAYINPKKYRSLQCFMHMKPKKGWGYSDASELILSNIKNFEVTPTDVAKILELRQARALEILRKMMGDGLLEYKILGSVRYYSRVK